MIDKKTTQNHTPVMLQECIQYLQPASRGIYVDGTFGRGGHAMAILDSCDCKVIAFDKDRTAVEYARTLVDYKDRLNVIHSGFENVLTILKQQGIASIDGAILDLGVSSPQIDNAERGFSYMQDGPLDMRMDTNATLNAKDIVNSYDRHDLITILNDYGQESFSKRIVDNIIKYRVTTAISTTSQLVDIIKASKPYIKSQGHPAKKTFMALRIATNNELGILQQAIIDIVSILKKDGVIAVLSFHSLEDSIIKTCLRQLSANCICDKSLPVCVCNHKATVCEVKKFLPTIKEKQSNPRASSAILRIAKKI